MANTLYSSRPIVVLGMHRSGTSALTRLINLLGVELGPYLMPPSKDNEKGYWEHNDIATLHDKILSALGSRWSDTRPLPENWWEREEILSYRTELISVIKRDFGSSPLWGFKDPRTCRLLPLWHGIFNELGATPSFIIIHRHPEEVASSLSRRDGFSRERSLLLWLDHILTAERYTQGLQRVFVTFEGLLSDWRKTAERISQTLGLEWPVGIETIEKEAEQFITPSLRHHSAASDDTLKGFPWIEEVHRTVTSAAAGIETSIEAVMNRIRAEFETSRRLFAPMAEDSGSAVKKESRSVPKNRTVSANSIKVEIKQKSRSRVSIIIPVFNKIELTKKCLESLFQNTPEGLYEIIIVDNSSTDGTGRYLASLERPEIKIITNNENLGFARACNQGAAAASSEYLLFLNNDTEPQKGWLEALLSVLDNDDTVAAAGSKLLFPNKTIQHAGVIIVENRKSHEPLVGVHAHYGKPADLSEANSMRTYQALTAASLLIRSTAFHEAGGFDEAYWNGYEDVDLCFTLGARGWKLVYQPESVLIHHESQSGPERFSKVHQNIARLIEKWAGKVKPDMIVEEDGTVTIGPAGVIRPYTSPNSMSGPRAAFEREMKKGLVSIVILTFNELRYTKECLESIMQHTPEEHEIIFVDNGSTDGTVKWLRQIAKERPDIRLIENKKNLGFAKGCNQGINASSGEYILLLNNDTVVTEGWLSGMLACLGSSNDTGIVGPMTNNISGLQKVPNVPYTSITDLEDFAREFRKRNLHRRIPARRLVGFCMLFRRELVRKIGLLDERFGSGNFEDDDLCLRAGLEGYRNVIAGDVFIHHYGSRSFIGNRIDYRSQLTGNRRLFSEKWSGIDARSSFGKRLIALHAMEKAEDLYHKGQIDDAVSSLLEGIKFVRDDNRMRYALAEMLIDNRQFKEAMDVLTRISGDEEIRRTLLLGCCHAGLEEYDEAEACTDRVLAAHPGSALGLNLRGIIAFGRKDRAEADKFFRKAIASDPGYGEPHTNLGILAWADGRQEEALKYLERGFILSPASSDNISAYHRAITETARFSEAEPLFIEANALYPNSKKILFLLIDILLKQEKYIEAMERIEQAMLMFGIDEGILAAAMDVRHRCNPYQGQGRTDRKARVSLCMIVKDEEERIAKCISAAKPLADEIIVVDTGSSDRTKMISEAFGAKVYDFAWTDDFSAARNFSISKATGDWIFVLDADEVVSPADHKAIIKLTQSMPKRPVAYRFVTRNYVEPVNVAGWTQNDGTYMEEAGTGWFPGKKVRLFPRDGRIRFENPVHELVEPSLKRIGIEIRDCNVPIHHYGKLNMSKNISKGEAYYELGKKKLEQNGDDPAALRELAIQAGELRRFDEARDLWKRFIRLAPDNPEAYLNLGSACIELGMFDEGLSASKRAVELRPDMKEAVYNYSICELCVGEPETARRSLEALLEKDPSYPSAMAMLGVLLLMDGEKQKGLAILSNVKKMGYDADDFIVVNAKRLASAGRSDHARRLLEAAREHQVCSGKKAPISEQLEVQTSGLLQGSGLCQ